MKLQALLVVAAVVALGIGGAKAGTQEDSRIAKLEETVRLLEQRVAALEEQRVARASPAAVEPGKAGWRKLKNGMTEADVEQLLGSPSRVDANPTYFLWHYGDLSEGYIEFNTRSRKVEGWREPR